MSLELLPGDPAPWFVQNATPATAQRLHMLAGQPVVLHFFGDAPESDRRAVLEAVDRRADIFDGQRALLVGVSCRSEDRAAMEPFATGAISLVWDFDSRVAAQYGLNGDPTPTTLLLDAGLRIVAHIVSPSAATQIDALAATLRDHLAWARLAVSVPPVLVVPGIFEPALCRRLIEAWESGDKTDSGFMREHAGKTVLVVDHRFKRRIDVSIADPLLRTACLERVRRRLLPAVERAFQYRATRMERYMVAAYDRGGGWFRPHRDNTTRGTAHRRFAVTINLDAEAFEGGDLRFPEFGRQTWRAPTGGAIVFSCSLLHEVVPVTEGRRFAFLPFLYDEAAATQRTANNVYLDDALKPYPGQSEGGAA